MSKIKINVNDQRLSLENQPLIASGGVNEDEVEFTFSAEWSNYGKTAVFYREDNPTAIYKATLTNGIATIPHEVTDEKGVILIGVAGISGNVVRTSQMLRYDIEQGAAAGGQESVTPSPSIYQQILSELGLLQGQLDNLIVTSAGGVTNFHIETVSGTFQFYADYPVGDYVEAKGDIEISSIEPQDITLLDITYSYSPQSGGGWSTRGQYFDEAYISELQGGGSKIVFSKAKAASSSHENENFFVEAVVAIKDTAYNAELHDIRTGFDGTVYTSAGAAVRAQIQALWNAINGQ